MKTKIFKTILIFCTALVTFNCSNNEDEDVNLIETKTRLTEVIHNGTTTPLTYNNQNQLISYGFNTFSYNNRGQLLSDSNTNFTAYNEQGKPVSININSTNNTIITINLTYNAQGLLNNTYQTRSNSITNKNRTYYYDGSNRLIKIDEVYDRGSTYPVIYNQDRITYDTNNNISKVEHYGKNDNNSNYYLITTTTYTYDDKKNTGNLMLNIATNRNDELSFVKFGTGVLFDAIIGIFYYYPKNNITSEIFSRSNNGFESTDTYTYNYNEKGYPITETREYSTNQVDGTHFIKNYTYAYEEY